MSARNSNSAGLAKALIEKGFLIEAGWIGFCAAAIPPETPKEQLLEMRSVFFAGSQHLFSSIMEVLDPGEDPTEADLKRFSQIADELARFIRAYEANMKTAGTA